MKLREIMTQEVATIEPDASLQQAAQMMASLDVGMLPVILDEGLLGVITDRDITVRATARGFDPKHAAVSQAMTNAVICGYDSQDIQEGARLMMEHHVRRLPILNGNEQLIGVVSLADLSRASKDKRLGEEILERVSAPVLSGASEHRSRARRYPVHGFSNITADKEGA